MMSSLSLEYKGKKIPIAGIDIKSSNENVTFGSLERDLILKTLGKIYVQVGNKYYELNFDSNNNSLSLNNIVTVNGIDKVNVNNYPDGTFLLETESMSLYLIYNKKLIELVSGNGKSKLFLSYAEEQDLSGNQIHTLVYNARINIKSLDDILKFTYEDVYENQIIYVEDQKCHYILDKYNTPNALSSWRPIYLTTMGGTLYDGLTIYNQTKNYTLALEGLHKEGDDIYKGLRIGTNENYIKTAATTEGIIKTEFNGKALVLNRNNNTIFEYNNGNIGIGGKASRGEYNNILYGTSKLTGDLYTNYNIMSDDFQSRNITSWDGGQGYALKKTSIGTWFLEVDDLVVRNSISAEVLNLKELVVDRTYATGGHMMVTDGAVVSKVEYYTNITEEDKSKIKHPLKESKINGTLQIGESYYFVYFNDQDKDVDEETGESEYDAGAFCPFIKGDILLCQSFTGLKTKKYYAIVSYSDNYRVAINYKDFYGSYIIVDADRPSTDFDSLNSIDVKDELVRVGNEDPKRVSRQKVIDIDGTRNWITMYDNLNSLKYAKTESGDFVYDEEGRKIATDGPLTYENLKLRIGNLAGLPDHAKGGTNVLPDDVGYGLFADNVYLKGKMVLWRVEDGVEYSEYLGINRGKWNAKDKYYVGDKVTHNGSYYYCSNVLEEGYNIGLNPEDYTDFWILLVARGADGIPGQSVTYVNITGLSYFKVDSENNSDPISITLTANLYNVDIDSLLKSIRYQWVCNNTIVKDVTFGDKFEENLKSSLEIPYKGTTSNTVGDIEKEINWTNIWSNANYNTFICNIFINGTQIAVDQFTIYKIKDGQIGQDGKPGLTIIASNEAIVIPSDYNGFINPNFIGKGSQSSCTIDVFRGTEKLVYDESSVGENKYKISISSQQEGLIDGFFEKFNNSFYLVKGHYDSSSNSNPKLPESFIVDIDVNINNNIYKKKVSYALAKAGQDANLLDWVKEWTGNSTEIQAEGIISPKIYVGDPLSKEDGKYVLKNGIYLGRGLNGGDPATFVGYREGFRTFELGTDGRFFLGKQIKGATPSSIPTYSGGGLSFDGNKLIIGNDSSIGGGQSIGNLVTVVDEHKESINNIVGDKFITPAEKFKLREISARISQEYKDVETSLAGLLGISEVPSLPSHSSVFNEYKVAYEKFNGDLNFYINKSPDEDGFIPVDPSHDLNTSNTQYYNKLVNVRQEIENQRINRFNENSNNVIRQQAEPISRNDGSPLQIGDIWISIDSNNNDLFSKVVISINPVVWRFLGDNTGTSIDNGIITSGTIKLTSKTDNQVDKAGITGSDSHFSYFNPNDLSDFNLTNEGVYSSKSYVRFWAGLTRSDQNWNDAPFRVYENGAIVATAGKIGGLGINGENIHVGGPTEYDNIITTRPEPSLLRKKPGLTIKSNGDIVGQDYFLSGDAEKRASVFIGDFYFIEQPSESIYNQFTSVSSGLNALNKKFDSMFALSFVNIHNGTIIDGSLPDDANPSDYKIHIKAKMDFFSVGGITAKGGSGSNANFWKGLPIDPNTLAWDSQGRLTVIGGGGKGGDIMLNGKLYKSIDGVITLPNLKPAEPTTFKLSSSGNVEVRTPGRTGYYEFWDSGSEWAQLSAKAFAVVGGTSSQFLKADGSVDNRLYALAYNNNQNKVLESNVSNSLHVIDRRDTVMLPTTFEDKTISTFFNLQSTPTNNWWSGIAVKGWSGEYGVWMLAGPAAGDNAGNRLYYKDGNHSNWATDWKGLAFLDDVKNIANVYFNGQNIYSDYEHWVVGLIRIGDSSIGDKYISGEMIYRRSNGIYANGSVRFNLIKKYNSTKMFAGVFYNGYGVAPDQDAPRLCTFTYQGVKWGGLCWRSAASLNSIKTIVYDNSSTDTPFYVLYYNSQSSSVINAEINSSISVLGSDIDVQPVSTNGRIYTSADRLEINNITNGWAYVRYRTNSKYYDVGLSGTTAGMNGAGNFEIRPGGSNNNGIFVRHSGSSYGKLGVVSKDTQECSISYFNNAPTGDYPLWTVGAGIRNQYSFDWWYHKQGYKATLDSEGKLFVNVRAAGNPYCSLTIGDYDTGLSWVSDGVIGFRSNAKDVGFWGYTNGRLYNCYFREPSGVSYEKASLMINGNGSTISPSIGFHQPGVVGCNLRVDNGGNFLFEDASNYKSVYAYNFVAAGWLYSTANSCEVRIGSQNASYVHITNNKSRPYYMDNRLDISGHVIPYSANIYDLGESGKPWRQAYINNMHGSADAAGMLNTAYIGGQQPNPQTYFNNITGFKVAMTGVYTNGAYWSDTLWINGYSGLDVPECTTLHFPRDGSAEMYISSQESKSTSYGAVYRIWSSRNSNKNDTSWVCSTLNARDQVLAGSYIQALGGVNCAGVINSGGCSGFNVYATFHGNRDHGGIEIAASDNVLGIGVHKNDYWYMWWTPQGSVGNSSLKSYIFEWGANNWRFTGNILATGGITAETTSDMRLKNKIGNSNYIEKLLSLGPVFDYTYNDIAKSRVGKMVDNEIHTGLSYQDVSKLFPTMCGVDEDGYGYINYISPDFISLIAGAVQLNILNLREVENRTEYLERRIAELEKELYILKNKS